MTVRDVWYQICTTCRPSESKTVRFTFPFLTLALALFGASVLLEDQSYVKLTASADYVEEGEVFFITVEAVAHTPVNAIDLAFEYPQYIMDVTNIDIGQSVITLWTEQPYAEDGIIYIRGGTFRKGFIGEHHIARIRARATSAGIVNVTANNIRFLAGDGQGTEVSVADVGTQESKVYIGLEPDTYASGGNGGEGGALSGTASIHIITDLDGDGKVTLADISRFMVAWRDKSITFDFNGDGRMTFRDFGILLADSFFK